VVTIAMVVLLTLLVIAFLSLSLSNRKRADADSGGREAIALAERLHAPVCNSYLHNDSFPASHPLWCGPLGYQGSKAAMKLIAQADVVLALGTRLGPFGTLPQYGMEYWPAGAKIIQVDVDPRVLGLVRVEDIAHPQVVRAPQPRSRARRATCGRLGRGGSRCSSTWKSRRRPCRSARSKAHGSRCTGAPG
jgi:hypothetical protein